MKNKNTSKQLTIDVTPSKPSASTHTPSTNLVPMNGPKAMMLGNLEVKQCYIADLGDGVFTDDSIKIKPNRSGHGIVMKCTDRERLIAGLAKAGIDPRLVKIQRGRKHWVAFVTQARVNSKALVKA